MPYLRMRRWHEDLVERLVWAREWSRAGLVPAGLATQFVVGPAGEHDQALLRASSWLYRDLGLRRVYFGAFAPVVGPGRVKQASPCQGNHVPPPLRGAKRCSSAPPWRKTTGVASATQTRGETEEPCSSTPPWREALFLCAIVAALPHAVEPHKLYLAEG
ncbi:MAG: hypothetical protein AB4911_24740 [Oscillochloridaceae bacterium umkhey_bin13]